MQSYLGSKKLQNLLIVIFLFLITLLFYGNVLNTWFQQDEWDWLGRYTYYNSISNFPFWEAFKSSLFPHPRYRFTPFFDGIFAAEVFFFGLNFKLYALVNLLLHTINSYLIYRLTYKLSKNWPVAILASILFASSSIGQKAVTWVFTGLNTQGAALFSLVSLINFFDFLEKNKKIYLLYSFAFLGAAFWFKETAISILPILPLITILYSKNQIFKKFKFVSTLALMFGAFYFILRFALSYTIGLKIHTEGYPDFGRFLTLKEYLGLSFWTPIRSIVDNFLFPNSLYSLSEWLTDIFIPSKLAVKGSTEYGLFIESSGVDIATVFAFVLFATAGFLIYKKLLSVKGDKRLFLFALVLILSSTFVHMFLSIRGTSALASILRSRDIYLASAGTSIILAQVIYQLFIKKNLYLKIVPLIFLLFLFFYHYTNIKEFVLQEEMKRAATRKNVMESIYNLYPNISKSAVIYTTSDSKYYGHSVETMPFQTGFGRTFLVWYMITTKNFPPEFAKDDYLYMPLSQGVKTINGSTFGYFQDFDEMIKQLNQNNLSSNIVYAFSYEGKTETIKDISLEIRAKIKKTTNEKILNN